MADRQERHRLSVCIYVCVCVSVVVLKTRNPSKPSGPLCTTRISSIAPAYLTKEDTVEPFSESNDFLFLVSSASVAEGMREKSTVQRSLFSQKLILNASNFNEEESRKHTHLKDTVVDFL